LRNRAASVRPLSLMNLLLYGLATKHLSRVLTKDAVTSVIRAPFTESKENAGLLRREGGLTSLRVGRTGRRV